MKEGYNKQYYALNRNRFKKYREEHKLSRAKNSKKWRQANRKHLLISKRDWIQDNFVNFLKYKLKSIKDQNQNRKLRPNQKNKNKKRCNIDIRYLINLLKLQEERCAATGLKMTHKHNSCFAVSIDRINSAKGHIKGNIQLVCQFYNLGKKDSTDEEARKFIQAIRAGEK